MIGLHVGDWYVAIDADAGAAVKQLHWRGRDILAPAAPYDSVFESSCFAMLPFANRIAGAAFVHAGQPVRITALPGSVHAQHGVGWNRPWQAELVGDGIVLTLHHTGDGDWPWAFDAVQRFAFDAAGVTITLALTNSADSPMPTGLGLHPRFPRAAMAQMTTGLGGYWAVDATKLPDRFVTSPMVDWRHGAPVRQPMLIDHCHADWNGVARLVWPAGPDDDGLVIDLTASPQLQWLHVYAEPESHTFCIEPVTHRPDAVNASDPATQGMADLAPGATLSVWMRLAVVQVGTAVSR